MVDYYIRYVDMPSVTKGMTIEDSAAEQEEAIKHEIRHLERKDFDTEKSLREAEAL